MVLGHVTSSSAMIMMDVFTFGIASQTWIRLFAIETWKIRIFAASRDFTNVTSFWYLSDVVTKRSSYGRHARMLWMDSLNSSKLL
jgi:hypothetical protein